MNRAVELFYQLTISPDLPNQIAYRETKENKQIRLDIAKSILEPYVFHPAVNKEIKKRGRPRKKNKLHQYMITFTIDPEIYNKIYMTKLSYYEKEYLNGVEKDALKCLRNKQIYNHATFICWVREGTKHDRKQPHWHIGIQTKKYLDKTHFNSYKWGHVDIDKSSVVEKNNILNYFIEDKPKNTINYLKK